MEKSRTLWTNMVFVCYLLLKETSIHINFICFHRNLHHSHIAVITIVPRKQSKKPQFLPTKAVCLFFLCEKVFDMYLLLCLSSLKLVKIAVLFLKNCYLIVVLLKYCQKIS